MIKRRKLTTRLLFITATLPALLFLLLPLLGMLKGLDHQVLLGALTEDSTRDAVLVSLRTSLLATVLIIIFGTPLSVALARKTRRGARKEILENLIALPLVLPPAVAGVALLMTFGRQGVIGSWLDRIGVDIAFTGTAVVLAQAFVAAPFFIRSFATSLAGIDEDVLEAAAICGADSWGRFWSISLPLAWPGFITGTALAWCRAMGEFGATIIFAGNLQGETQTMPLAIYLGFERSLPVAVTLSLVLLVVSAGILAIIKTIPNQRTI
jgi:molybdate transport system permease protein